MISDEIKDKIICDECELEVTSKDDLFPYEGMNVCIDCYDKLNVVDELELHDWEAEGYDYE